MDERKITTLKTEQFNIEMPTKVRISDPMYIEEGTKHMIFSKRYTTQAKNNWVAHLEILHTSEVVNICGEDMDCDSYKSVVTLAPNKQMLDTYRKDKYYRGQKVKEFTIGVDTAEYMYETNLDTHYIRTGADGYWGQVWEYRRDTKLEGVQIIMEFPADLMDYKEVKTILTQLYKVVEDGN